MGLSAPGKGSKRSRNLVELSQSKQSPTPFGSKTSKQTNPPNSIPSYNKQKQPSPFKTFSRKTKQLPVPTPKRGLQDRDFPDSTPTPTLTAVAAGLWNSPERKFDDAFKRNQDERQAKKPRMGQYNPSLTNNPYYSKGISSKTLGFPTIPGSSFINSSTMLGRPAYFNPSFRTNTPGTGFVNLGNTCYMNAVLQVLLSLPSFTKELRDGARIAATLPDSVLAALADCAAMYKTGKAYVTPAQVKKAMGAHATAFQGYLQQDAHEFYCNMLDAITTEMASPAAALLKQVEAGQVEDPGAQTFGLTVQHQMTCVQCRHVTTVDEEFNHLSIELPARSSDSPFSGTSGSIGDMLSQYFRDDQLEKHCEKCSAQCNVVHTVKHNIKRLPRVLALHVKRFQMEVTADNNFTCRKLGTRVAIPTMLSAGRFCTSDVVVPAALPSRGKENDVGAAWQMSDSLLDMDILPVKTMVAYRAHAIVTHHGSEATAGHFTAVIHNPQKNDWTRFDDSRTQIISQAAATDESQQRNCYMVFYTLK